MFKETLDKKCKLLLAVMSIALICLLLVLGVYVTGISEPPANDSAAGTATPEVSGEAAGGLSHDGYKLEQVVVLSRHNIRAPLRGGGSVLEEVTPYEWIEWSSPASQLSIRGGTLETGMGQYFRKWLEHEGLFPENYHPEEEAVRVYANSKQRTIATARFFTSGLMPTDDEEVEYHVEFNEMDPVFTPMLRFLSDKYEKAVDEQIEELYADDIAALDDNYGFLEEVIDMDDSPGIKDGSVKPLTTDDTDIIFEKNEEPAMNGSLKTANSVSDAMTLQYYEAEDPAQEAFGKDMSEEDWNKLTEIKSVYNSVMFATPLLSYVEANPLLKEISSEMGNEDRQFTFLCGHDCNIISVLTSLRAEKTELPGAIEKEAPIGSKIVFSNWKSEDGGEYWSVDYVYETVDQLKSMSLVDLENPPAVSPIRLEGLEQNEDGLYAEKDLEGRFDEAIGEYKKIIKEYK